MTVATVGVEAELAVWGPGAVSCPDCSLDEAHVYCRKLARTHYENFPLLLGLAPRRLRRPLAVVYAWCRWADDLADEIEDSERSLELLRWWREELTACFDGRLFVFGRRVGPFDLPIKESGLTQYPQIGAELVVSC